jgi:two-component system LytT family response regulator
MIRTIIIDDEIKARETIQNMLTTYTDDIEVIATAGSVKEGLEVLRQTDPDLVFLDIKMGDGTGFDLLKNLKEVNFFLIFITAFEEFAIRAIKFSALDYILKPLDPDELISAVDKARDAIAKENISLRLEALFDNLDGLSNKTKKIVLKTTGSVHIVSISDIVRCESEKNYTHFYTVDREQITVSKTLKEYSEMLVEYGFYRVHQSHLVNLMRVKRYDKTEGGSLIMDDDSIVPVSYRKKDDLMKMFNNL